MSKSLYALSVMLCEIDNVLQYCLLGKLDDLPFLQLPVVSDSTQHPVYASSINIVLSVDANYWKGRIFNWISFRNFVIAPLAEELIFRACITFHLLPLFSSCIMLCFVSSLFFSVISRQVLLHTLCATSSAYPT
ncbi:prenyl protein peptidase [Schistosoma japonicum]|nr:prenyl protein peptidase [Schistosoma japonicum]